MKKHIPKKQQFLQAPKKSIKPLNIIEQSWDRCNSRISLDEKINFLRKKLNALKKNSVEIKKRSMTPPEAVIPSGPFLGKKSQNLAKILFSSKNIPKNNKFPTLKLTKNQTSKKQHKIDLPHQCQKQIASKYHHYNQQVQNMCIVNNRQNKQNKKPFTKFSSNTADIKHNDGCNKQNKVFPNKIGIKINEKANNQKQRMKSEPQMMKSYLINTNNNKINIDHLMSIEQLKIIRVNSQSIGKQRHILQKDIIQNNTNICEKSYEKNIRTKKQYNNRRLKISSKAEIKKIKSIGIAQIIESVHQISVIPSVYDKKHEHSSKKYNKFYIKKGNNDQLIRRLLQKRGWKQTRLLKQADFVWSQSKQATFIEQMGKLEIQTDKYVKNSYFYQGLSQNLQDLFTQQQTKQLSNRSETIYKIKRDRISMHNHLYNNYVIAHKKYLFKNLHSYYQSINTDPFKILPKTFHIKQINSVQWKQFDKLYCSSNQNIWIVKPGQNSNRGCGIKVYSQLSEIRNHLIQNKNKKSEMTFIIQRYIQPYLYNGRKFDLRCFFLVTVIGDKLRAYWYKDGYVRTASKPYSKGNLDNKFIHLTNDAVQRKCEDYGKYQPANKISFKQFEQYLFKKNEISFQKSIYPKLINITQDVIKSTFQKIHKQDKNICFQIFGLDFLIDDKLKPWLIEVNRNPCLETTCSLMQSLISNMVDNALAIAIDPFYSIPPQKLNITDFNTKNKYQCIFTHNNIWSNKEVQPTSQTQQQPEQQ